MAAQRASSVLWAHLNKHRVQLVSIAVAHRVFPTHVPSKAASIRLEDKQGAVLLVSIPSITQRHLLGLRALAARLLPSDITTVQAALQESIALAEELTHVHRREVGLTTATLLEVAQLPLQVTSPPQNTSIRSHALTTCTLVQMLNRVHTQVQAFTRRV
jgi:hypothetical protein